MKASNKDRVFFAVRGFLNTYRFPSARSRTAVSEIVIRPDVSGEFPESEDTERELFEQAQKIDGDFDTFTGLTAKLVEESKPPTRPKWKMKRSSKASVDEYSTSHMGKSTSLTTNNTHTNKWIPLNKKSFK